jgi:general stress protein CsbA
MKANEGSVDRIVRLVLGVILILAAYLSGQCSTLTWVVGIVGAIALITGAIGWCGLYAVLGINTCKVPKKDG